MNKKIIEREKKTNKYQKLCVCTHMYRDRTIHTYEVFCYSHKIRLLRRIKQMEKSMQNDLMIGGFWMELDFLHIIAVKHSFQIRFIHHLWHLYAWHRLSWSKLLYHLIFCCFFFVDGWRPLICAYKRVIMLFVSRYKSIYCSITIFGRENECKWAIVSYFNLICLCSQHFRSIHAWKGLSAHISMERMRATIKMTNSWVTKRQDKTTTKLKKRIIVYP